MAALLICTAQHHRLSSFPTFDCTVLFDSQSALFDLSEAYIKNVIIDSIYPEVGDQVVQFRVSEFRSSAETDTYIFIENRSGWTHMDGKAKLFLLH